MNGWRALDTPGRGRLGAPCLWFCGDVATDTVPLSLLIVRVHVPLSYKNLLPHDK